MRDLPLFINAPSGQVNYATIAEAIVDAIDRGRLRPGDRLPAQRELAGRIGVALGTVSRAYAVARRAGLITGRAGQGTFVSRAPPACLPTIREGNHSNRSVIDLTINRPPTEGVLEEVRSALGRLARDQQLSRLLEHQPSAGMWEHRALGAEWVSRSGIAASAEQVVICNGVQHTLAVIFGALAEPGDLLATEELTYPGVRLLENLYGLRVSGLPMDEHGLVPDALAELCREEPPKFLLCTPSVQNPTCAVMPERRRQEIADLAKQHDIIIVENDIYGPLLREKIPAVAAMAPERSLYITGTSKCVAAGIRVGYLVAPAASVPVLATAVQATTWMALPLMVEIISQWMRNGTLERIVEWHRGQASTRQRLAADVLKDCSYQSHEFSYHVWIQIPAPWRVGDFMKQLQRRGVLITPAEAFVVGRGTVPHAVRVSLGGETSPEDVAAGLRNLANLLKQGPRLEEVVV